MNPILVPILFTVAILAAVYFDFRDEVPEKCKTTEDWATLGLALLIKPGLFIAVVWALFLGLF